MKALSSLLVFIHHPKFRSRCSACCSVFYHFYKEGMFYQTIDFNRVLEERQNFDVIGDYSRPDVTKLYVNRERQSTVTFEKNIRNDSFIDLI